MGSAELPSIFQKAISSERVIPKDDGYFQQNIKTRKHYSLVEIAGQRHVPVTELPGVVRQTASGIVSHIERTSSVGDDLFDDLDVVYQCWQATRSLPEGHPLSHFANSLNSFDSFNASYMPHSTASLRAGFFSHMDGFVRHRIHSGRILYLTEKNSWSPFSNIHGIYNTHGEWTHIPDPGMGGLPTRRYVHNDVIDEIAALQPVLPITADVFHSTGSSSLPGIGEEQALISAFEANKRGREVKSGERTGHVERDTNLPHTGGELGLYSLYGAMGNPQTYGYARWFDEHHITFGMSVDKLRADRIRRGIPIKPREFVERVDGDVELGYDISLDLVDVALTEHRDLPKLHAWKQRFAPHLKLISLEAFELIREFGTLR